MIRCAGCGERRAHYAKQHCFPCFHKMSVRRCGKCKQLKQLAYKGYCLECFGKKQAYSNWQSRGSQKGKR